jgi:hypothetical protein
MNISQDPMPGGATYTIGFDGDPNLSMIAPGGIQLGPLFGGPTRQISGLDFADIQGDFFGTWTIRRPQSPFPGPGAPLDIWEFDLAPFDLDDVYNEIPVITSHSSGDIVGESFVVSWAYPPGATAPTAKTISVGGAFNSTVTFDQLPGNNYGVNVVLDPGIASTTYSVRAGSFENLNSLISPIRTIGSVSVGTPIVELAFRNLSAPITLTTVVVPEPSSIALSAVLICGLAIYCRGNRNPTVAK